MILARRRAAINPASATKAPAATKVAAIEAIDEHVVGPIHEALASRYDNNWRLLMLPDHNTRVATRKHDPTPVPFLMAGKRVLIAAHGNSMRALVKHLDGISDEAIVKLVLEATPSTGAVALRTPIPPILRQPVALLRD
jgi:2,3-bisphosphoglycerate-independent phosphoglycerate mutase